MSSQLSEGQNFCLGTTAAFIEAVLLQPTLYWKNARAQQLPFTLNPRLLYRGTAASIYNECQMMGLQFVFTGLIKKSMLQLWGPQRGAECPDAAVPSTHREKRYDDLLAALLGGMLTSVFSSPVELVMIQQQRFGGNFLELPIQIYREHGFFSSGLMRGLVASASRDSIYACGLLGITPLLQEHFMREHGLSNGYAGFYASMLGGVAAAVPSQPFDVVKTCMQGDLLQNRYQSLTATLRTLIGQEGGLRRLYSGCFWRTVNITLTIYIANECRVRFLPMAIQLPL